MKKILCLLVLALAAVAYAGDKPLMMWANEPMEKESSAAAADSFITFSDAGLTWTGDVLDTTAVTADFTTGIITSDIASGGFVTLTPTVTIAPAATGPKKKNSVRHPTCPDVVCKHCGHEFPSCGRHVIWATGTQGTYEFCIDSLISILSKSKAGAWLPEDEDE